MNFFADKVHVLWNVLALTVMKGFKTEREMKVQSVAAPVTKTANSFYTGNREPLLPLKFVKLPAGSIKPGGWLKKFLCLQREGLTGNLGEVSAWLEKKNNAWFCVNGSGEHGWEEVPYWLKGYGDLGYVLDDPEIIAETRSWLEKVFESQRPDGSFGPMAVVKAYLNNNNGDNPDLWPNMIMLWCMQSWYEYSGDARVISFMSKYFRWQSTIPEEKFLKLYWENSRGGDNLYSIYWLYNRTGESWLLELAEKVHRNTANWIQKDTLPNWHNVNIAQCFREPAIYYMQSKNSAHLKAAYNNFRLIREHFGQVPGGMFGADENAREGFDDPRQAIETCGMVEQMSSDEIMAKITGDTFWADHCEDVAFNTYPAAVMPDFKALRYLTAPNMVVSDGQDHAPGIDNKGPDLMMNPFISRCCQHNHAQGWPYYAQHLWMATPDNGLAAILYSDCTVTATVGTGKTVTLREMTNYPFDTKITIQVNAPKEVKFPLYLRIPSWTKNAGICVNGSPVRHEHQISAYTVIDRKWNNGDTIEIVFPMDVRIKEWKKNKNSVSVNYGPLTFSLKINEEYQRKDSRNAAGGIRKWQENVDAEKWPSYEIFPASKWNYGLYLNGHDLQKQFEVVKKPWPADDFPFTQQNVPVEIRTKGKLIPEWQIDQHGLCGVLPQSPVENNSSPEDIVLIPMGAARLRISSFPVARHSPDHLQP